MTYKWTMAEVDEVEMPMLFCLMDEIGETPPNDFLVNAQWKAEQIKYENDKQSALTTFPVQKGTVKRRGKDGN